MTQQNLVFCIVAPAATYCFSDIAKALESSGCEILNSHMNSLDDHHIVNLFLTGNWGVLIKTESMFRRLAKTHHWELVLKRTALTEARNHALLPYTVNCMSVDKADIPKHLESFFSEKSCYLISYNSSRYQSNHSRVQMQSVNARILVPAESNLGSFREDFYAFCDDHNYEAVLDPDRN